MAFNQEQLDALKAPLSRDVVKTREQAGRKLSYVEGWHVIAEANRIFGFDAWSSETIETHCVVERERLVGRQQVPGWGVTYTAKVRIKVHFANEPQIYRDGCGTGHGIDIDIGQAHESALKEAETDALKRALMKFGNQFGLALYDKEQTNVVDEADLSRQRYIEECKAKIAEYAGTEKLIAWWSSDEQYKARRDFELRPPEVLMLKSLVKQNLPPQGAR